MWSEWNGKMCVCVCVCVHRMWDMSTAAKQVRRLSLCAAQIVCECDTIQGCILKSVLAYHAVHACHVHSCGPGLNEGTQKCVYMACEHKIVGLARTVYTQRIWPYVWWFPCQKYRIYTVYTYTWMVLAIPTDLSSSGLPCKKWRRIKFALDQTRLHTNVRVWPLCTDLWSVLPCKTWHCIKLALDPGPNKGTYTCVCLASVYKLIIRARLQKINITWIWPWTKRGYIRMCVVCVWPLCTDL